ncbi:MAG: RNA polymerase sigma factor [Pirellulaceae bacterium]|jgi:RNA polymerase sigma-70 factor (ECF subfamily)|nr:RNA polymerase sigma factor [Pirellulaceae bacterium]MDP7020289.1 RNA polymerase sigma factor [Pirellulaceae bacterium]
MDDSRWEELVEQHYQVVLRAALTLTGDRWEAADLAQETFLQAIRGGDRFRGDCCETTWLYSILLNQHRKHCRLRSRAWKRIQRWFETSDQTGGDRPSASLEAREWSTSIWRAVGELPAKQQHVVVLRYAEGLSNSQIADILACPLGTVKSRLHHALSALQQMLSEDGDSFARHGEPHDGTVEAVRQLLQRTAG